jgi:hypothetical protein
MTSGRHLPRFPALGAELTPSELLARNEQERAGEPPAVQPPGWRATVSALHQASQLSTGHRQHRQVDRLCGAEVGH